MYNQYPSLEVQMDSEFPQQQTKYRLPSDVSDELAVFLSTNLSTIISPHPSVLLTPAFQAALQSALNSVGSRHHLALSKDLKDILDVFIIANINVISVDTTP